MVKRSGSGPLAPYAMPDELTRGRRYAEPAHPYRPEFQRDRDRVVHTKAFRRLERKTQVFAPDYSDHFRNRLTHTIEVSQIARTASRALGLNTDLCEVLALAHDIGHPPFGHEGERVLDELMKGFGSGFDHNLHALRIVEDFEEKYAAFRGLNLTWEVREGIVKHSRDYQPGEEAYLDLSEYRLGERPTLEAQLIDLADEIAYNSADLDDGFDSGLLALDQVREEVELFGRLYGQVERRYPSAPEKLRVSETLRRLIDRLVSRLVERTLQSLCEEDVDSLEKVRALPRRLVGFDPETARLNRQLKEFLSARLYSHPTLETARKGAARRLGELFRHYLEDPARLPASHRERLGELSPHRVVCDYVAGMTDTFAESQHRSRL